MSTSNTKKVLDDLLKAYLPASRKGTSQNYKTGQPIKGTIVGFHIRTELFSRCTSRWRFVTITALKLDSLDGVARSCEVQYTVQAGDLADSGEEITQGKTYSSTRHLDSLVILSEEDNLLEEFSTLSSDAEEILNAMFEVEPETSDMNKETSTEKIVNELLYEVIGNISEDQNKTTNSNTEDEDQTKPTNSNPEYDDQTKLTDSSIEKPACTKNVSFYCTEEYAVSNSEPEAPSCTKKFSLHKK